MSVQTLHLQPKQGTLLELVESGKYDGILYGGALGGGKSRGIRLIDAIRRDRWPGSTSLIFRRTYPELRVNHIDQMLRDHPYLEKFWSTTDKTIYWPNSSQTVFASADDEKAVARFMGMEFGDIFADQGEQISEDWHGRLRERNRQTGVPGFVPQYVISANPGGISHGYLKRIYVDRKKYIGRERAGGYAFVQAFAWDNVEWSREALEADDLTQDDYYGWTDEQRFRYFIERTHYGRILDSKPTKRRNAMLLGRWDEYDGQYFDCFDPAASPVPYASLDLKPWTQRWISMDWGYDHPTAVYWHAQISDTQRAVYREFTVSHMGVEDIAHAIGRLTKPMDDAPGEHIKTFFLGADAFAEKTDEQTINIRLGKILALYGIPQPTRASMGPGSRVARARAAYDGLAAKSLLIADTCPELIECLPNLVHNPDQREDILKVDGDDRYDGWAYGLTYGRVDGDAKPWEQKVIEAVANIPKEDITSRNIAIAKMEAGRKRGLVGVQIGRRNPVRVRR